MLDDDTWIFDTTRVRLYDAVRNHICSWSGYELPSWLAVHLNDLANMNASMTFRMEWETWDRPVSIPVPNGPLAIMVNEVLQDHRARD